MIRINGDTEIARTVDAAHFGKIKSGIIMMISWASLIVYGAIGYLADQVSVRNIYLSLGVLVTVCAVVMLARMAKPTPQPAFQ
jgi:hypothetical protein